MCADGGLRNGEDFVVGDLGDRRSRSWNQCRIPACIEHSWTLREVCAMYIGYTITKPVYEKLREILFRNGVYFEPSGCYDRVHIEIYVPENDVDLEIEKYDSIIDNIIAETGA